jgi:hypothetical protein
MQFLELRPFALYLLLWYVQKFQLLVNVKAASTGKIHDNLPRNDAVAELCSVKFTEAYCRDPG